MDSSLTVRNTDLLKAILKAVKIGKGKGGKREKLFKGLKCEHLQCLNEIVLNFLNNNLPNISQVNVKKLKKHKNVLYALASKKISNAKSRKIYGSKKGGSILALIIPAAISLASSLLTSAR